MRIGLIGIGLQGQRWERIAKPNVILRTRDEPWFNANVTTDFASFIQQCDRVIDASPGPIRRYLPPLLRGSGLGGYPVLSEKPLVLNSTNLRYIADAGTPWVNYTHLWHPTVEAMPRRNVDAECVFRGPTPREPLLDWGPHALAVGFWLLGTDALVANSAVSADKQRCTVDLMSERGLVRCDFGASPVKTTRVKMNAPNRIIYTGEPCDPDPMTRLFKRWIAGDGDDRTDIALSMAVHRVLDEVLE